MNIGEKMRLAKEAGDHANYQDIIDQKRRARMDVIDRFPADIRAMIHEYGFAIVKTLLDCGVKKPKHIKHVIETVVNELSPTRGSFSKQGVRTEVLREWEPKQ